MVDISLILPDLSTLPDVGEPLQHNHVSRVEAIDDAAADVMVEPSHKATLSPRKPPQESFSSLGRVGLECRPLGLIPPADVHSLSAAESQTVATGCQVDDAKVNAYDFSQFSRRWNGLVLEPDFIRGSVLFSCLKDVVARFSKLMQRILKSFMVLRVNLQLAADGLNKFHRRKHITYVGGVKAGTFLPA